MNIDPPKIEAPSETDILRFCVDLGFARDDEDQVKQVIEDKLSTVHAGLHTAYLKVVLRVMTAQFYSGACRRLDRELGYDFADTALGYQEAVNEGRLEEEDADERPMLSIVHSSDS